jgi:hypothetical protein
VEEVSERLQHLKREAKAIAGNCLLAPRLGGYVNLLRRSDNPAVNTPPAPAFPAARLVESSVRDVRAAAK